MQPVAEPFDSLPSDQFRQVLYTLYRRLYRIPYPLQDPNFRYMLKQIKRRSRVGGKAINEEAIPEAS